MDVTRYSQSAQAEWDQFVTASKNGTFLFQRAYMDYHADRFSDHSLLVRDEAGKLLALLPAHAVGPRLVSHGGLTYGGLVTSTEMKVPTLLAVFQALVLHLRAQDFTHLAYKTIPHIYHRYPAEEDLYALFLAGAALSRRDVLTVVQRGDALPYQQRRDRSINKARKAGLVVSQSQAWEGYWAVLEENLFSRYQTRPVHTLAEIQLLAGRFPENIHLFACWENAELLGGVVVYAGTRVAHVQYIASTERGRKIGALDLLFDHLLGTASLPQAIFDFGISNEEGGRVLNRGLIDQKEGFGARAVCHDQYELDLAALDADVFTRVLR